MVFPSDGPSQGTGTGAIVWRAAAGCVGGEGARVAGIGAGDVPGASAVVRNAAGRPLLCADRCWRQALRTGRS